MNKYLYTIILNIVYKSKSTYIIVQNNIIKVEIIALKMQFYKIRWKKTPAMMILRYNTVYMLNGAFEISSPRNITTYCDIVVLPQKRNDDDGDTTIHVYMDTDEVNSSMYKDALSYDLLQSEVQHDNLLMNFIPIMHVDTIIDDGRKNVRDIQQQPRPNKQ